MPTRPPLALPLTPDDTTSTLLPGSPIVVQTRLIKAPRDRVWAAWTNPEHLGQWWGPKGFSLTTDSFEFREGGHWIFMMHGPDPSPESANPGGPRDFPNHIVWTRIQSAAHPGQEALQGPWLLEYHHVQADKLDTTLFKSRVRFEAQGEHTLLVWEAEFGSSEARDFIDREYKAALGGRETTARLAHHTEGQGFDELGSALGHPLMLSRVIDVPRHLVWRAWTDPQWLPHWFCPKPYGVDRCEIDLRAGGRFYTHMIGPDGWSADNDGSYLEVVPESRLTFTDLLLADWTPNPAAGMRFTASVHLEDAGPGRTRYTAIARHVSNDSRAAHARMGFHEGWGTVADQMVAWLKQQTTT